MKKSRAGGRHKWKWHKKTERAVFSLVAIANTKAWGEALIEATEWHAQSNWISSAVSSNLIWPALWRMTGERNTFPCPPLPLGVPRTQRDPQTCRYHTTTGQHLLCGLLLLLLLTARTAPSPLLSTPPGNPCYTASVPHSATPDHPGFLCLSNTSASLNWDLQTLQGHGRWGWGWGWGGVRGGVEVMKVEGRELKRYFFLSQSLQNCHTAVIPYFTERRQTVYVCINIFLFPKTLFWMPASLKEKLTTALGSFISLFP